MHSLTFVRLYGSIQNHTYNIILKYTSDWKTISVATNINNTFSPVLNSCWTSYGILNQESFCHLNKIYVLCVAWKTFMVFFWVDIVNVKTEVLRAIVNECKALMTIITNDCCKWRKQKISLHLATISMCIIRSTLNFEELFLTHVTLYTIRFALFQ